MQPNNIRLAIFDMAGTTVHDENFVTQALCEALEQEGYPGIGIESANAVMGIPKPEAIGRLLDEYYPGPHSSDTIEAIHKTFLNAMIRFYQEAPGIKEMDGATATFLRLKEMGVKVGLDTGFSRDITDTIINRLGWDKNGILDVSVTSDEVANGRPHPDMIYKAMELLHIDDVKMVAKIGDTPVDLQEGHSAACGLVIGVWSGSARRETLEQYPHTVLLPSITEVPGVIEAYTMVEAS